MHHLLVWTKRKGWLSQDKYPEIHRHFKVGDFSPTSPLPDAGALLVVDEGLLPRARRGAPARGTGGVFLCTVRRRRQ